MSKGNNEALLAPISWGELVDKITILGIKVEKIRSAEASANVRNELNLLNEILNTSGKFSPKLHEFQCALSSTNRKLWDIEDKLRVKESLKEFDSEFIQLARSVYLENDKRASIKRDINFLLSSTLIEEKQYMKY